MPKQNKKKRIGSRRVQRRKRQRIAFLSGLCLAAVLIIFAISYGILYRYVHKVKDGTVANHIFIGETEVSGMTSKEALSAVKAKLSEYEALKITMKVGDETAEATLSELGFTAKDVDKLVEQAVSYGKKGSVWKRYHALRKLKKEKKVIKPTFKLDQEAAAAIIDERAKSLEKGAVDASVSYQNGSFVITDEENGRTIDTDTSLQTITKYLNEKWDYKDAVVTLKEVEEEAAVKRADLESIQEELGSYSTEAGSGNRVTNLKRAAELLNGTVIMPGEEFSVEQATLPYSEENGYVDGGAYENGEVVQSIAGGICQVSTTLYNAVLYAELEVTERSPHSIIVTYVDPSRDAAIAEGIKDFKFKNNYDTPILIEGYIDANNQLGFYIYGKDTRPEGHSVEYESETLEKMEYTKKYIEDPESSLGALNTEGTAINGRTARLWKVVYENGEEVSRDVINNSTYKPTEMRVKVGTSTDNAEAANLVRTAIASQDEATINEAIAQAKALINGGE